MFDQVDIDCTNEFDNNFDNSFANTNAKSNHVQVRCLLEKQKLRLSQFLNIDIYHKLQQVYSISSANANGRRFNPSIPYERTNAKVTQENLTT